MKGKNMNNSSSTQNTTAQAVRECLELLFIEVARDPFGDDAKYGSRMIVRTYGERVSSAVREIIEVGTAQHGYLAEMDRLNDMERTEGANEMFDMAYELCELQSDLCEFIAEQAAKSFMSLADVL
jgi:hypothetical protein